MNFTNQNETVLGTSVFGFLPYSKPFIWADDWNKYHETAGSLNKMFVIYSINTKIMLMLDVEQYSNSISHQTLRKKQQKCLEPCTDLLEGHLVLQDRRGTAV